MKLTMNIIGEPTPTIQPGGMNYIGVTPRYGNNFSRKYLRELPGLHRLLNAWDFTTDLFPPQQYNKVAENIKIVEWGTYNDGVYTPSSNINTPIQYGNGATLTVGSVISVQNDLGFNLEVPGENQGFYIPFYSDQSYFYIRYSFSSNANTIHTLHVYFGAFPPSTTTALPTYTINKSTQVPPNTIVPVTMGDFDLFDWYDQHVQDVQSVGNIIGSEVAQNLLQYYGEFSPEKFLKVYMLDPNYSSSYSGYVQIPRLLYKGNPVHYGQALSYKEIENGQLLLNTTGVNQGGLELYFGIESLLTIKIFYGLG